MIKRKNPSEDRLILELNTLNSSIKIKGMNHQKTLQAIANKWVDRRCYNTLDRALRALIGGEL